MRVVRELTGQRFGRLIAVSKMPGKGKSRWQCQCDCGNDAVIEADNLRHDRGTKSCGCLHREATGNASRTHGLSKTPTYKIWKGMKRRCYNPNDRNYRLYGAKGVRVCERWLSSFENFLADMGERPARMSIERSDSNGNYEPSNCMWATATTQNRNRSMTRYVEVDGRRMSLSEACAMHGIKVARVHKRLKYGWDLMDALRTPLLRHWVDAPPKPTPAREASYKEQSRTASSN